MRNKLVRYGHRGISAKLPENTLIAIQAALETDNSGCEFDVEITKDNVPVLIHQETFKADKAFKQIFPYRVFHRRSWVHKHTWAELKKLDCGSWFSPEYSGEKLITLDEALTLDWSGKTALIELKDNLTWDAKKVNSYHKKITSAAVPIIEKFVKKGGSANILSFSPQILKICLEELPHVPRVQNVSSYSLLRKLIKDTEVEPQAFCTSETIAMKKPEVIKVAHEFGYKLFVYEHTLYKKTSLNMNLRKKVWQRLEANGADAIISNFA